MPDFDNDFYTDTKELLSYINGFLHALESLNSFTNHVAVFYVQQIERDNTYSVSIHRHLNDTNYEVTLKEVADWKYELEKSATAFF